MTSAGPARPASRGRVRPWTDWSRGERRTFAWLTVFAVLVTLAIVAWPSLLPVALLCVPLVTASLLLKPVQLPWYVGLLAIAMVVTVARQPDFGVRTVSRIIVVVLIAVLIMFTSVRRGRLGVAGARAEAMLLELRERIQRQGGLPQLPADWDMQQALHAAGGTSFAGDFAVATRRGGRDHLEFCLVDVSGKGDVAGVRAMQLAGALGGILGSLPPAQFLVAANDWVLEQEWDEGFATAVHVSVDLATGGYEVRSAGHPPAMVRAAGSGRWQLAQADGPALGFLPDVDYGAHRGQLRRGDLLMVCTDGVIETSSKEAALGIDRLTGVAEATLTTLRGDLSDAAERILVAASTRGDDRALVLLRRL